MKAQIIISATSAIALAAITVGIVAHERVRAEPGSVLQQLAGSDSANPAPNASPGHGAITKPLGSGTATDVTGQPSSATKGGSGAGGVTGGMDAQDTPGKTGLGNAEGAATGGATKGPGTAGGGATGGSGSAAGGASGGH